FDTRDVPRTGRPGRAFIQHVAGRVDLSEGASRRNLSPQLFSVESASCGRAIYTRVMTAILTFIAVCLDALLGEPRRWHPLVGFGRLAQWVEHLWNPSIASQHRNKRQRPLTLRVRGIAAVITTVAPWVLLTAVAARNPTLLYPVSIGSLYFALGHQSLR